MGYQAMKQGLKKIRLPASCAVCSVLAHLAVVAVFPGFGSYRFGAPVLSQAVTADLVAPSAISDAPLHADKETEAEPGEAGEPDADAVPVQTAEAATKAREVAAAAGPAREIAADANTDPPQAVEPTAPHPPKAQASPASPETVTARPSAILPPVRYEKLTYLVTMLGIPVGSAELESKRERGVTSITLKVRSNAAFSAVYPVDDLIETDHVDGRFIMTKVRQAEGAFRGEESYTINPGKKRVSWQDLGGSRAAQVTVPTSEVLDTLSGIYSLRSRELKIGRIELLHIFDSERYGEVPVEVLRREELRLPNLQKVGTLVVRPIQQTPGIFRRTGDLFIWMTDDENRVPVKVMTSIALGRVTAELVSAESY